MVALPSEYLFVPGVSFKETGIAKTSNLFLFTPLRPSTPAPRPKHGYQIVVGGGLDSDESQDLQQRAFSGGGAGAATLDLVIKGATFTTYTQNLFMFKMMCNSKADEIYGIAITQSSSNIGSVTAQIKAVLTDMLAGDPVDAADGLVFTKNGASIAAISTALQNYFGADPDAAFDITTTNEADDTVHFTAGAVGADGNFQEFAAAILPGAPNLTVTFGDNFEPIIAGIGKGWSLGGIKDFKDNAAPTILEVPYDNTLFDFGSGVTGLKGNGSFTLKQRDNPLFVALTSNSSLAYGAQNTNLYAGKSGLARFGLIAVHPSGKIDGQIDFEVYYEAQFTAGLQRDFAKGVDPGIPVTFSALATDAADSIGFSAFFREF